MFTVVEYSEFKVYLSLWVIFSMSISFDMFVFAYLPNDVSKERISAFYFVEDLSGDIFDCLVDGVREPSGIEPNVMCMLSIRVSLNF